MRETLCLWTVGILVPVIKIRELLEVLTLEQAGIAISLGVSKTKSFEYVFLDKITTGKVTGCVIVYISDLVWKLSEFQHD